MEGGRLRGGKEERGRLGRSERAGDPGNVEHKVRAGPGPGAGPAVLDRCAAGRDSRPGAGGGQGGLPGSSAADLEEKETSGSAGAWENAEALLRVPTQGT